jgi:hypothetical protein
MTQKRAALSAPEAWTKSSHSGQQGNCVEWRRSPDGGLIEVRDSKDPFGPVLAFTAKAWVAMVEFVSQV